MKRKRITTALMVAAIALFAMASQAQGDWPAHKFIFYGWATDMKGDVGPDFFRHSVNADFSDLADKTETSMTSHGEMRWGRWGLMTDIFYLELKDTRNGRFYGYPVDLKLENTILGAAATYNVHETERSTFDFTFGLRYNKVDAAIESNHFFKNYLSRDMDWIDPVIGFKGAAKLSDRWTFCYLGDVGGFGVGSDLTWTGSVMFDAQVAKHVALDFGYRYQKSDYEKDVEIMGYDADYQYDISMSGPFFGVSFNW